MATVVGIVGTAKNTGKTTTLTSLIRSAHAKKVRIGVTGIGYDGEEIDNVTFLPKPRVHLLEDTIVTTSEECLQSSTAKVEVLERAGIFTSLGEVLILRVIRNGLVVIAGPNRTTSLATIVQKMKTIGVSLILIDGSLNRLAPMCIADRIVFTTGAARTTDLQTLAHEMSIIERIFLYPKTSYALTDTDSVVVVQPTEIITLPMVSLLDRDDSARVMECLDDQTRYLYVPGLISARIIDDIMKRMRSTNLEIIVADPIKLLIANEPPALVPFIRSLQERGVRLSYSRKPDFSAITINPFYPQLAGTAFTAAFVDKRMLAEKLRSSVTIPVFNVLDDDAEMLFEVCVRS